MARKKHFLIIDTETTQTEKVADLGIVLCDRQGNIVRDYGLLVREFYLDREQHPLFHMSFGADPLWGKARLPARYQAYDNMLVDGRRMLASIAAVNRLLVKIRLMYNPVVTAYNLAFDRDKMNKSGIDLTLFSASFCLWHASVAKWANTRKFKQAALDNHLFGNRTKTGALTMRTNAEIMAQFVLNDPAMLSEPHTALEDARDYELPILTRLIKTSKVADYMNPPSYNWRDWQMKRHFIVA